MSKRDRIQSAHAKSLVLLERIEQLQNASSSHEAAASQVEDLQTQLITLEATVQKLSSTTKAKLEQRDKLSASKVRHFASQFGVKKEQFQLKNEKNELDYRDALEKETEARAERDALGSKLPKAIEARDAALPKANLHVQLRQELDALYKELFSESSADTSVVDMELAHLSDLRLEQKRQIANAEAESQTIATLREADRMLNQAQLRAQPLPEWTGSNTGGAFGGGFSSVALSRTIQSESVGVWMGAANRVDKLLEGLRLTGACIVPEPFLCIERQDRTGYLTFDDITSALMAPAERKDDARSVVAQARFVVQERLSAAEQRQIILQKSLAELRRELLTKTEGLQEAKQTLLETLARDLT